MSDLPGPMLAVEVAATEEGAVGGAGHSPPVLGRTLPHALASPLNQERGAGSMVHQDEEIDLRIFADRATRRLASRAHVSQALPNSAVWRRLEPLGDTKSLRWLRQPIGDTFAS